MPRPFSWLFRKHRSRGNMEICPDYHGTMEAVARDADREAAEAAIEDAFRSARK